jgi:hypothetical protein
MKSQLEVATNRIEQLEAAVMAVDDVQADGNRIYLDPVEVKLYEGKHAGVVVTVHRPKAPA